MRSLFGSPGGSGQSSRSRRERIEAAREHDEKSRRRTFAFMKYSPDKRSSTSMSKTRAHAKQLAMAYSTEDNDPASLMMDFGSNPASGHLDFDPFNNHVSAQPSPLSKQSRSSSLLDQHLTSQEPTASTTMSSMHDSFETASIGSAYDMDFLASPQTGFGSPLSGKRNKKRGSSKKKKNTASLDQFVGSHQTSMYSSTDQGSTGFYTTTADMNGSGPNWPASSERSVISMPAVPSQANYGRQTSAVSSMSSNAGSATSSGGGSGGGGSVVSGGGGASGAAARRRMRNQLRHQSSASSVCSETSSVVSTPPESPASVRRTLQEPGSGGSSRHIRRGSNSSFNRLVQYQQPVSQGRDSFHSQNSSTNNSQFSDSNNLFDSKNDGGFTFDAFGLDASEVGREVDEAMQELAGQVPGFSAFFDNPPHQQASPNQSIVSNQSQLLQDEFAPVNWDSPVGSRNSTPTPMDDSDSEFVDGFRITHTNSNGDSHQGDERIGMFQEPQAFSPSGGAASRRLARNTSIASSTTPPRPQSKQENLNTPPRWETADRSRTKQEGDRLSVDPFTNSPDITEAFGTPANPWNEDPWTRGPGSDDEAFLSDDNINSDVGTNSDMGVKSDIVGVAAGLWPSSINKHNQSRLLSDSKSDVGVGSGNNTGGKSVSFSADVRLPPPEQHYESGSDWTEQMDENDAHNFAANFAAHFEATDEPTQQQDESEFSEHGAAESDYTQSDYGAHSDMESNLAGGSKLDFEAPTSDFNNGGTSEVSTFEKLRQQFGKEPVTDGSIKSPGEELQVGDYGPAKSPSVMQHNMDYGPPKSPRTPRQGSFGSPKSPRSLLSGDYGPPKSPHFQDYGSSRSPRRVLSADYEADYGPSPSNRRASRNSMSSADTGFSNPSDRRQTESPRRESPAHRQSPSAKGSQPAWLPNTGVAKYGRQNSPSSGDYRTSSGSMSRYNGSEDVAASGAEGRQSDVSSSVAPSEVSNKDNNRQSYGSNTDRSEEKKDDNSQSEPRKFSLKDKWLKWEAKTKAATSAPSSPAVNKDTTWASPNRMSQREHSIGDETLTPEINENREQSRTEESQDFDAVPSPDILRRPTSKSATESAEFAKQERLSECNAQRGSFASLRERLKSTHGRENLTTKSEGGAHARTSAAANQLLTRIQSPRGQSPRATISSPIRATISSPSQETQSDSGSKPNFLANVKLRKTASSKLITEKDKEEPENDHGSPHGHNGAPMSYRERQALEQQQAEEDAQIEDEKPASPPPERKLTYRERRELELKREQEAKAKLEALKPKEPSKLDVASQIRRRIAANKVQSATQPQAGSGSSQYRDVLKPTKTSSPDRRETSDSVQSSVSPRRIPPSAGSSDMPHSPHNSYAGQQSPRINNQISLGHDNYQYNDGSHPEFTPQNVLSPSSVDSDMNYSTDNSHHEEARNIASNVAPNTRTPSDYGRVSKSVPRAVQKMVVDGPGLDALKTPVRTPTPETTATSQSSDQKDGELEEPADDPSDVRAMLVNFLGGKASGNTAAPEQPVKMKDFGPEELPTSPSDEQSTNAQTKSTAEGRPALKDDPKYERYFRMLKVGMPMEVVKHAMMKDGFDPSVMDGDHDKPVGLPLKDDPKYAKYFKMLKFGIAMDQVKHAMERDGLMPDVMDQDHNLPAISCERRSQKQPKEKPTHRRARLHWKTLQKVRSNSLWAKIEEDQALSNIDIDEEEFNELFKADLTPAISPRGLGANRKRGAAVRVIDAKRANNGGIILARLKMTHDEMADAVDRIDGSKLSPEQIEHIIEFLPTKDERKSLEAYMLEGGQDAAEKFDGLCECEKFMVSMMTVKHAKRKVRALLFRLQFLGCLQSIAEDTSVIETACNELSNSTRLRQLLGIVLEFGNRLNTAGAQKKRKAGAFSLDSLLKLNQAKAFDKKTTFLHYIVMIVRKNNELLLRFQDDLPTVLKAEKLYWDQCLADLEEVENQLENVRRISLYQARMRLDKILKKSNASDDDSLGDVSLSLEEEVEALRATPIGLFTLGAIKKVSSLRDKVEETRVQFNRVLEYFGEEDKKLQPHEVFHIFSVFCRDFVKAKEEVFANMQKKLREERKKARQNTPNGKPPTKPPARLKASSLQPNMSKVIQDLKKGDPSNRLEKVSPRSSRKGFGDRHRSDSGSVPHSSLNPTKSQRAATKISAPDMRNVSKPVSHQTMRNGVGLPPEPTPPGMQESGMIDVAGTNKPTPLHVTNRQQYPQAPVDSSSPSSANGYSAQNAMREKARMRRQRQMQITSGRTTPISSNRTTPSAAAGPTAPPPQELTGNSSDPRNSLRSRRRLIEARKRHSPASHMPPKNGVSPNVAAN